MHLPFLPLVGRHLRNYCFLEHGRRNFQLCAHRRRGLAMGAVDATNSCSVVKKGSGGRGPRGPPWASSACTPALPGTPSLSMTQRAPTVAAAARPQGRQLQHLCT